MVLLPFHVLCLIPSIASIIVVISLKPWVLPASEGALMAMNGVGPLLECFPGFGPLHVVPVLEIVKPVLECLALFHVPAPFVDAPWEKVELALSLDALAIGEETAECSLSRLLELDVVVFQDLVDFFFCVSVPQEHLPEDSDFCNAFAESEPLNSLILSKLHR